MGSQQMESLVTRLDDPCNQGEALTLIVEAHPVSHILMVREIGKDSCVLLTPKTTHTISMTFEVPIIISPRKSGMSLPLMVPFRPKNPSDNTVLSFSVHASIPFRVRSLVMARLVENPTMMTVSLILNRG
jgi:hypothetical protein